MRRRILWVIGAIAGIALIAAAGPSLYWGFAFWDANRRADQEMGPYVREIRDEVRASNVTRKWGERVEIDPKLIAKNSEKGAVDAKLLTEKFKKVDETFQEPTPKIEGEVEIYWRGLGGLPCNTLLQLYLVFDDKDQLVDASGAIFEAGCL